jgi:hypothetical protein
MKGASPRRIFVGRANPLAILWMILLEFGDPLWPEYFYLKLCAISWTGGDNYLRDFSLGHWMRVLARTEDLMDLVLVSAQFSGVLERVWF